MGPPGRHTLELTAHLVPTDSELAQQLVRDPYVFDHLGLSGRIQERDVEQGLMDHLLVTCSSSGTPWRSSAGSFTVVGDELIVDLLLFRVEQLRYIVIELKIGQFEPAHVGRLGSYVDLVDDRLRTPDRHSPTFGILLVAGRNEAIVRYGVVSAPLAVTNYNYGHLPPAQNKRHSPATTTPSHPRPD